MINDKLKCRGGFALLELCAAFAIISTVSITLALILGICFKAVNESAQIRSETNLIVSVSNSLSEKPIEHIDYLNNEFMLCEPENAKYFLFVTKISQEYSSGKSLTVFEIKLTDLEGQTIEIFEKAVFT